MDSHHAGAAYHRQSLHSQGTCRLVSTRLQALRTAALSKGLDLCKLGGNGRSSHQSASTAEEKSVGSGGGASLSVPS